jgi:hypothetical protein
VGLFASAFSLSVNVALDGAPVQLGVHVTLVPGITTLCATTTLVYEPPTAHVNRLSSVPTTA